MAHPNASTRLLISVRCGARNACRRSGTRGTGRMSRPRTRPLSAPGTIQSMPLRVRSSCPLHDKIQSSRRPQRGRRPSRASDCSRMLHRKPAVTAFVRAHAWHLSLCNEQSAFSSHHWLQSMYTHAHIRIRAHKCICTDTSDQHCGFCYSTLPCDTDDVTEAASNGSKHPLS